MNAAALFIVLALSSHARAAVPEFAMTLERAESAALARSPRLAASRADASAAAARAEESASGFLPRLTLDGYYKYQTEVPQLSIVPGTPARAFGDHRATSVGPALNWTLWDEGAIFQQWKAQKARAASSDAFARAEKREAVLGARLAYFQLQLAREQLALLADSLALADAEYEDIAKRERAGASSRLDSLQAHQAALQRRRDYLDQQAALGAAFSELVSLTGDARSFDPGRPGDARRPAPPAQIPEPTVLVAVDALSVSTQSLATAARRDVDPNHPRLTSYENLADAARLSASAAQKGAWPKIQFTGSIAYLYPNGPVLESVWQKSAGLSASIPLFEFGRSRRDAEDYRAQAAAAESRKEDVRDGLERERAQALERLAALQTQGPILDRSVAETDEIARLTYSAYKAGRSTFLEVQSANLGALEAKTSKARADAQALIQLATLASLVPENLP